MPVLEDTPFQPRHGTIAPTDRGWYDFLHGRPDLDEVNFWTPSAHRTFRAEPFSPFFFKLKAPANAVCGFGWFARFARLPVWLAWECFGAGNGCASLADMRARIDRLRARMRYRPTRHGDQIGCIVIVQPRFFAPDDWEPQPRDWPVRSLTPVRRALDDAEWRRVFEACRARATLAERGGVGEAVGAYGAPRLVRPRLGQGAFRVCVTEAYERACAVTGEHSLPALEAAHIRPFAERGAHDVRNGLLLRADLHRLFDQGYLTISADARLEVSRRLREEFDNGRSYYPLHGSRIRLPGSPVEKPDPALLRWHNENRYLG